MIKFNEDHYHLLEPYEDRLRTAQKGYMTGMTRTVREPLLLSIRTQ